MIQDRPPSVRVFALVSLFISGMGCVVLYSQFGGTGNPLAVQKSASNLAMLGQPMRAVGLFFGTQAGKTEEAAGIIAGMTGLEAKEIGDVSPKDLEGFDGIIAGVPTWHTGADEQRSGTRWDDYLEEIRTLNLCGKPVAIFGLGDSVGYGENFCDAIEELHSTFEAAGAKMLGYTPDSGYEYYADSKSVKDGKFLGLPLDGDNESDMSEDRIKTWVDQLKAEGMPVG